MKVMLLFPPNWTPSMPHLALPTLTAFLRAQGVEVIQRDLNLEVFDRILTREHIDGAVDHLRRLYGADCSRRPQRKALPPKQQVQWSLQNGPRLAKQVEQAKDIVRSESFMDGPVGLQAFETVIECLEIASLPYYPANLNLQSYVSATPVDSSRSLLEAVANPDHNMFIEIYRNGIIQDIVREQPDVVGVSIPSMPQMLAGMTLCHLVKETGLDCHISVGGPHISMLRDELPGIRHMFDLFDSAVVFDGEVPLLKLVEALEQGKSLAQVPNLIYRDGDAIRITERKAAEKIDDVPLPDFEGLPIGRYLAPYPVLPLLTARGCYFGKCAFCNVGYGEPESFSQLRAHKLAEQMLTLQQKYGVDHIFFSDEAVTPRNLRDLSRIFAEQEAPIHWGGCVRFERVINADLLKSMHEGGCRMILFGLESASEPIMELMIKGTKLDDMGRILVESTEAGIWNHTFFFFGFPGETLQDAQETVNFLYQHKQHINSAAMGTFLMERYSPAYRFPDSFGVKTIIEDPDKDLAIYFDYEVESGMDNDAAELIASRFMDTLPDKRFPQFYVNDVYRFIYASYHGERGLPMPPWLVPETETA